MGETGRHFASLFPSQALEFDEDHIDLIQLFAMVSKPFYTVFYTVLKKAISLRNHYFIMMVRPVTKHVNGRLLPLDCHFNPF